MAKLTPGGRVDDDVKLIELQPTALYIIFDISSPLSILWSGSPWSKLIPHDADVDYAVEIPWEKDWVFGL